MHRRQLRMLREVVGPGCAQHKHPCSIVRDGCLLYAAAASVGAVVTSFVPLFAWLAFKARRPQEERACASCMQSHPGIAAVFIFAVTDVGVDIAVWTIDEFCILHPCDGGGLIVYAPGIELEVGCAAGSHQLLCVPWPVCPAP